MAARDAFVVTLALAGCMALSAVAIAGRPAASQRAAPVSFVFDIPAQPLQAALELFMTITSHSGLYDSGMTAGRYSSAVIGAMEAHAALRQLTAGSGLTVRYATEDTFSIAPGEDAAPVALPSVAEPGREEARTNYFAVLQENMKGVFCRHLSTLPGTGRIALSLWVSPAGVVEKVRLLDTSGSAEGDARIADSFRSLRLPALPGQAGIRQPITVVLEPKPPTVAGDCIG